jgi:hypothetical protein
MTVDVVVVEDEDMAMAGTLSKEKGLGASPALETYFDPSTIIVTDPNND